MTKIKWDEIEPSPDHDARARLQLRRSQREQRQQRGFELRRQTVVEVAWLLLQDVGLSGFNMRLLGDRASYTAGALYSYFPGRDDVLAALRSKAWEVMGQVVEQTRPAKSPRAAPGERVGWWSDTVPSAALYVQRNLAWWRWLAAREPVCELVLAAPGGPLPGSRRGRADAQPSGAAATERSVALAALGPCVQPLLNGPVEKEALQTLHAQTVTMGLGCLLWRHSEPLASLEDAWMTALEPWVSRVLQVSALEAGGARDRDASMQPDLFAEPGTHRQAGTTGAREP